MFLPTTPRLDGMAEFAARLRIQLGRVYRGQFDRGVVRSGVEGESLAKSSTLTVFFLKDPATRTVHSPMARGRSL